MSRARLHLVPKFDPSELGDCQDPNCDACRATRDYDVSWSPERCINLGRRVAVIRPDPSWRPGDRSAS